MYLLLLTNSFATDLVDVNKITKFPKNNKPFSKNTSIIVDLREQSLQTICQWRNMKIFIGQCCKTKYLWVRACRLLTRSLAAVFLEM